MGIYIKEGISRTVGQDMPDNCLYDCRLLDTCLHVPRRWSDADKLDRLKIERAKGCPLSEIPVPHGKLIDADKLYSIIERYYHVFDGATNINDIARRDEDLQVMSDIVNAPTVIEAEGE